MSYNSCALCLFDNTMQRPRMRREPYWDHRRYTREVKGGAIQARVWLPLCGGFSLNLGLFTKSEYDTREAALRAASRAAGGFVRRWMPGVTVEKAVAALKADGLVPAALAVPPRVAGWRAASGSGETRAERARRLRACRLARLERKRYGGHTLLTCWRRSASA